MKRFLLPALFACLVFLGLHSFNATSSGPVQNLATLAQSTGPERDRQPRPVRIIRILRQHGFSLSAAAGVAGNALQESGWSPASQGMGGGGLWGFTASPVSLADMQSWAAQRDMRWDTVRAQTLFLVEHIGIHDSRFLDRLNSSSSAEEAAALFCWEWERPYAPTANMERRAWGAREALEMFRASL